MKLSHVILILTSLSIVHSQSDSSLDCVLTSADLTTDCVYSVRPSDITDYHLALLLGQFSFAHSNYTHSKLLLEHALSMNSEAIEADELFMACLLFLNDYQRALQHQYGLLVKYGLAYSRMLDRVISRYTVNRFQEFLKTVGSEGLSPVDLKNRAIALFFAGNYQEALKLLAPMVQQYETITALHLLYIRTFEKLVRHTEALDIVRKWLNRHPQHYYLHHCHGNLLMHHLKFSQAVGEFELVTQLQPLFQLAWYNKALCEQRLNKPTASLQTLMQLQMILKAKEWSVKQDVYNAMGHAYFELNDLSKAESYFRRALEETEKEDFPRKKLFLSNIGNSLKKGEHYSQALVAFEKAHIIDPDSESVKVAIASCLAKLNRVWQAVEMLKSMASKNIEAAVELAEIHFENGKGQQALQAIAQGLKLDPKNVQVNAVGGRIYYSSKKYEEAVACFSTAILKETTDPSLYFNRGMSLIGLGKCSEAKRDFEKAKTLDSDLDISEVMQECSQNTDL